MGMQRAVGMHTAFPTVRVTDGCGRSRDPLADHKAPDDGLAALDPVERVELGLRDLAAVGRGERLAHGAEHDRGDQHRPAPRGTAGAPPGRGLDDLAGREGREPAADEADEAVGGGGDGPLDRRDDMTAVVTSVLFTPMKAPAMITPTITTAGVVEKMPMTARSTAISAKFAVERARRCRTGRCSRGATSTEKTATSTPQPQNTRPSWIGLSMPMRNGE